MRFFIFVPVLAAFLTLTPAFAKDGPKNDPCEGQNLVIDCFNLVLGQFRKGTQTQR